MHPPSITQTDFVLQDEFVELGGWTEESFSGIFSIKELPTRSYEEDDFTQIVLSVEVSQTIDNVERERYNLLEFFSDVGGM